MTITFMVSLLLCLRNSIHKDKHYHKLYRGGIFQYQLLHHLPVNLRRCMEICVGSGQKKKSNKVPKSPKLKGFAGL